MFSSKIKDQSKIYYDSKYNCYSAKYESTTMYLLTEFFFNTYMLNKTEVKQWIVKPEAESFSGNLIVTYYYPETNLFELCDMFSDDDDKDNLSLFFSQKDFISLIDRFEELLQKKPDEIVITDNNGTFSLTGKFVDGREI